MDLEKCISFLNGLKLVHLNQNLTQLFDFINVINLFMDKFKKNLNLSKEFFELIENLPNNEKIHLLEFNDSCKEISKSKQFVKVATAGRHRGLNTKYIKHNLFHPSKLGRDVEL